MQQTVLNDTNRPRPFATTGEKYSTEYANGKVTSSNFPHYEIQRLPGYSERGTPSLSGSDVTKELARYLAEYAERNNRPLPYAQREIAMYLWWQASRGMLDWDDILKVIRSTKKRDRQKPIAHYFGYRALIERSGSAKDKILMKLVRYVTQEGHTAQAGPVESGPPRQAAGCFPQRHRQAAGCFQKHGQEVRRPAGSAY